MKHMKIPASIFELFFLALPKNPQSYNCLPRVLKDSPEHLFSHLLARYVATDDISNSFTQFTLTLSTNDKTPVE